MPSGEVGDLPQVRNVGSVPLYGAVWVELMGFSSFLRPGGGRGGAYLACCGSGSSVESRDRWCHGSGILLKNLERVWRHS